MQRSLISYLVDQPTMKIIRGLLMSPKPRHLRELATEYSLSPGGVFDIVRRLKRAGVLKETKVKNRRCFELAVAQEELDCLQRLFSLYEMRLVRDRATRYGNTAVAKFEWMDQAYLFFHEIKAR